mmetsp:Transcript_9963/g.28757  ORF Transcript_9963/g.28757 Transcript_9963/m.28757 type:complete len:232 (-) Transcript_9963:76-771(-)
MFRRARPIVRHVHPLQTHAHLHQVLRRPPEGLAAEPPPSEGRECAARRGQQGAHQGGQGAHGHAARGLSVRAVSDRGRICLVGGGSEPLDAAICDRRTLTDISVSRVEGGQVMERVEGKRPCLSVDLSDMPAGGSVPFTVNSVCLSRVSQCLMCLSVFVLTSQPSIPSACASGCVCITIASVCVCPRYTSVCMCCMCVHTLLAARSCRVCMPAYLSIYADRQTSTLVREEL